jgi:hypothetical protein
MFLRLLYSGRHDYHDKLFDRVTIAAIEYTVDGEMRNWPRKYVPAETGLVYTHMKRLVERISR